MWKDKSVIPRLNELSICETCQYAVNSIFKKNMINYMQYHAIGFQTGKANNHVDTL
jgi:hypothetical protein